MHNFTSTTELRGSLNSNHRGLITLTTWSEDWKLVQRLSTYSAFPGIAYMTCDPMVSIFFFSSILMTGSKY